ncbi:MAG: hypothetical protein II841_08875 [Bacteroidales bacterium]|nr:hypothetical protein [Bacteroidales bacterium]
MKKLIEKIIGLLTKRTDFTLHYLFSFLIVAVLYNILSGCLFWWAALIYAVLLAAAVGVGKELIDKYVRGQFIEKGDLISDGAGILTFVVTVLLGYLIRVL